MTDEVLKMINDTLDELESKNNKIKGLTNRIYIFIWKSTLKEYRKHLDNKVLSIPRLAISLIIAMDTRDNEINEAVYAAVASLLERDGFTYNEKTSSFELKVEELYRLVNRKKKEEVIPSKKETEERILEELYKDMPQSEEDVTFRKEPKKEEVLRMKNIKLYYPKYF